MDSILTHAIINDAKATVDSYVASANQLYGNLESIINTLIGSNFKGDASAGYHVFFTKNVTPALTDNLTNPKGSLTASIKDILTSIEEQLLNQVDPKLGENNQNPGAGE